MALIRVRAFLLWAAGISLNAAAARIELNKDSFFSSVMSATGADTERFTPAKNKTDLFNSALTMNRSLLEHQNQALRDGLVSHGFEFSAHTPALVELQKLSKKNLQRLLGGKIKRGNFAVTIARIQVDFVHNRSIHDGYLKPVGTLYSARALEMLGFHGGNNSQSYFNQNILKNDDQVYFHPVFFRRGSRVREKIINSTYGNQAIGIQPQYAFQSGWVSPYIMYAYDLARFYRYADPKAYALFIQKLSAQEPEEWKYFVHSQERDTVSFVAQLFNDPESDGSERSEEFLKTYEADLQQQAPALLNFDFTPRDFLLFVRESIRDHLIFLQDTDPIALARELNDLEAESNFHEKIANILYKQFPFNFEFKIPFAVPENQYIIRRFALLPKQRSPLICESVSDATY